MKRVVVLLAVAFVLAGCNTVRGFGQDIQKVGEYEGVPLFARRDARTPYQQLYVPVRPGVWQMYENLRATRG